MLVGAAPFKDRLVDEGQGLVDAAAAQGLAVRLMGGVGIRLLLGERLHPAFERPYGDLDILIRRHDGRDVERLIEQRGWQPAREFNALNGARRLLFHDPLSDAQIDVFVEVFEMCHRLPLADALDRPGVALPASDLLMSKLQIVELNAKDRNDCYALLLGCDLAEGDDQAIDPGRIAHLTAGDWGLHHTLELNLDRLLAGLERSALGQDDRTFVSSAIGAIARAMTEVPKTRAWKVRARIGERKRWYDNPEEVDRTDC
jgi:hypothetical protein